MTQTMPTHQTLETLKSLYLYYGAWTDEERDRLLPEWRTLQQKGILTSVYTVMGNLTLLSVNGRKLIFGTTEGVESIQSQLNRTYFRKCCEYHGYTATNQGTTRQLEGYKGKLGLREMMTEHGPALVGAFMTGGGISSNGLELIGQKLRSSALAYNFKVIVFTSALNKGQQRQIRYKEFLELKSFVPNRKQSEWTRVKLSRPTGTESISLGPFITEAHAERITSRGGMVLIPQQSLEILMMTKSERVEVFMNDLKVDRVISSGQLRRHYGLELGDLPKVPYVETVIRPVHMRTSLELKTELLLASPRLQYAEDTALGHYTGTGEMRRQHGIRADGRYQVNTKTKRRSEEPDSIFTSTYGPIALEYDTGTYTMNTIQKKLETFEQKGFLETLWGVSSNRRMKNLTTAIRPHLKRDVTLVEWWRDEDVFSNHISGA